MSTKTAFVCTKGWLLCTGFTVGSHHLQLCGSFCVNVFVTSNKLMPPSACTDYHQTKKRK